MTIVEIPERLGGGMMRFGEPYSSWWRRTLRKDPCSWCGTTAKRQGICTIEHVQPRVHGGPDDVSNLAESCERCNSRRSSETLLFFLLARLEG